MKTDFADLHSIANLVFGSNKPAPLSHTHGSESFFSSGSGSLGSASLGS